MSSKCVMLKWARREKHETQEQVANAIGISAKTISNLELRHESWDSLKNSTKEKLNEYFKGVKYWEPLEIGTDISEPTGIFEETKEEIVEEKPKKTTKPNKIKDNSLTDIDIKMLTLIEFAFEGLNESSSHTEFIANINLIKRILKKFD